MRAALGRLIKKPFTRKDDYHFEVEENVRYDHFEVGPGGVRGTTVEVSRTVRGGGRY